MAQPTRDQPHAWHIPHEISSQFENTYFTEMCSGSEAGSYLRLIDFVYHSTLGLRVAKKKRRISQSITPHAPPTPKPAARRTPHEIALQEEQGRGGALRRLLGTVPQSITGFLPRRPKVSNFVRLLTFGQNSAILSDYWPKVSNFVTSLSGYSERDVTRSISSGGLGR